jgi:hypothetical protein
MVAYAQDLDDILEIVTNVKAGRPVGGRLAAEVNGGSFWDAVR